MHKSHPVALAALLACISQTALAGEIYKCTSKAGEIVFSDKPCVPGSSTVTVKKSSFGGSNGKRLLWCDDGPAPKSLVDECLEVWRPTLRDPHSAYADTGTLVHSEDGKSRQIFIDGHARNGFGGINAMPMQCALKEGAVSPDETKFWTMLRQAYGSQEPPPPDIGKCK